MPILWSLRSASRSELQSGGRQHAFNTSLAPLETPSINVSPQPLSRTSPESANATPSSTGSPCFCQIIII